MKPKSSISTLRLGLFSVLAVMVLSFSVLTPSIFADQKEQSLQKMAQENLDVVSELVSRHLYDAALATIKSIDTSEDIVLSEKQAKTLEDYRKESSDGVDAQRLIVKQMEELQELFANDDYAAIKDIIDSLKDNSEYMTDDMLAGFKQKLSSYTLLEKTIKGRLKKQFAQSKKYYKDGDFANAKIGFDAICNSGVELSFFDRGGDFATSETYLIKISEKETAMASGAAIDDELDTEPVAVDVADAGTVVEPAEVEKEQMQIAGQEEEEILNRASGSQPMYVAKQEPKKSGGFLFFGKKSGDKLNAEETKEVQKLIAYGDLYLTKKKYNQAKQYFLEALAKDPDNLTAQKFLNVADYHINHPVSQAKAKELSILDKVKRQQALQRQAVVSNWENTSNLTTNLIAEKKYSQAIKEVIQALAAIESNKKVLGDSYATMKSEAEELRRQVELYRSEASALAQAEKVEEARLRQKDIADKIELERAESVNILFRTANEFAEKRRFQAAIDTIDRLITIDPYNEEAKYLRNMYEQANLWQIQHETAREADRNVTLHLIDADKNLIPPTEKVEYPSLQEWREKDKRLPKSISAAKTKIEVTKRLSEERIEIEFDDISLQEALDIIADSGKVVLLPMWPELDLAGITPDDLVSARPATMSIGKALNFVLNYVSGAGTMGKAGFEVDEEGNIIVKVVGDDYGYEFRTYYVGDLVRPTQSMGGMGGGMGGGMMGGRGGMGGGMMGGMGGGMMGGMGGGMMGGMGGGMMGGMGGGMMGGMGGMGGGMGFDREPLKEYNGNSRNRNKNKNDDDQLIQLGYSDTNIDNNTPDGMHFAQSYGGGGGMSGGGGRSGGMGGGMSGGMSGGMGGGMGGGGMGGGRTFETNMMELMMLQMLIQRSVEPSSWRFSMNNMNRRGGQQQGMDELAQAQQGYGMIQQFRTTYFNIYQKPEVHLKVAEFLSDLRSMHGDQVSIEIRLLTINNSILEDIGVDFDVILDASEHGWDKWSDIQVEQQHASWASPPPATGITGSLGGGAVPTAFTLSGSFLDNIQVDFLINATKANSRSRLVTAPNVTVFNGEQAYLNFSREIVYVSEMDPEVGVGVVGYDVSTDTLNSGIVLNLTPYISHDKRYVQMNINFQQEILDSMFDFAYVSTDAAGSTVDQVDGTTIPNQQDLSVRIQLPQTSVTNIDTRVSVPDGGTLLLGGQKLVGESERESGVPGLAHVPILNRLFSTRNKTKDENIILVLMKPDIIIQSEMEEDNFGSFELDKESY